jgi:hypothetical protein
MLLDTATNAIVGFVHSTHAPNYLAQFINRLTMIENHCTCNFIVPAPQPAMFGRAEQPRFHVRPGQQPHDP